MTDPASLVPIELASGQLHVSILPLGAAIHRVRVPDRAGRVGDVHLYLPAPADYLDRSRNPHLGGSVGRYANRIAGARFPLDGRVVELAPNSGPNQLHGGPDGFDRQAWRVVQHDDPGAVTLGIRSPDGDQGYPGMLDASVTYAVAGPTLTISYAATTDAPTVVNLTNHAYWNLAGVAAGAASPVDEHVLRIDADRYLPVDPDGIPIDGLAAVDGTPFDLRCPRALGEVLDGIPGGLDHSFEVGAAGVSRVDHPPSGRWLEVRTDQPGVQAYSGNHLHPPFGVRGAICLETQRFPDAPNRPELGPTRLDPGATYRSTTTITFGVTA